MGQKTHPYGFRLGVTKTWRSRWFARNDYAKLLQEDLEIKDLLRERLKAAGISSIEIDRPGNRLRITIRTSRPGIIIGRRGAEIEKLRKELGKRTNREVAIDILEVHKPELDAQLVAESIALQLEKRVAFRRAMRKAVDSALRFGCKGIKVRVAGRLNGAEIARSEWYLRGRLPLQTLRADIDYGFAEAFTTYGVIGVKAWIYRGEVLGPGPSPGPEREAEPRRLSRPRQALVAPPVEPAAAPVQPEPGELPQPARTGVTPIVPPLAPPRPAWKDELLRPAGEPVEAEEESGAQEERSEIEEKFDPLIERFEREEEEES